MSRFLTSSWAGAASSPTAEARTGPGKFRWVASSTAVIVWPAPSSVASFGMVMVVYVLTFSVSVYSVAVTVRVGRDGDRTVGDPGDPSGVGCECRDGGGDEPGEHTAPSGDGGAYANERG